MRTREEFEAALHPGTNTGCLLWPRTRINSGYGSLSWQGKPKLAHRLAWEFAHGPIPPKMCVLHKCDTRLCCNPDHLFLGTHLDNTMDMHAKGRWIDPPNRARGERHGMSKLTAAKVAEIRRLYVPGKVGYRSLGQMFGVTGQ